MIWTCFVLVVFLGGMFGLLYFGAGLKEYIGFRKNILDLKMESHKDDFESIFFGGANSDAFGGVVAWHGTKGVWVWGKSSLKYFKYSDGAVFRWIENCQAEKLLMVRSEEMGKTVKIETVDEVAKWNEKVKIGAHVFVYIDANKVNSITANMDVGLEGPEPIFCFAPISLQ